MNKRLHYACLFILLICFTFRVKAQEVNVPPGFYQTVDLSPDSACSCDAKTARHYELYKGIQMEDFQKYRTVAYQFTLGAVSSVNAKLFHALEMDPNVFKVSIHKWDYFMLFIGPNFDKNSFEAAARQVLAELIPISTEDFLLHKNADLLSEYKSLSHTPQ